MPPHWLFLDEDGLVERPGLRGDTRPVSSLYEKHLAPEFFAPPRPPSPHTSPTGWADRRCHGTVFPDIH
ncbi:hypothetical protein N9L68_03065 [bacterium]|nr:hypothetical protein [bacterium]